MMLANALLAVDLIPRQGAEEVLAEYSQVGEAGRWRGATTTGGKSERGPGLGAPRRRQGRMGPAWAESSL